MNREGSVFVEYRLRLGLLFRSQDLNEENENDSPSLEPLFTMGPSFQ